MKRRRLRLEELVPILWGMRAYFVFGFFPPLRVFRRGKMRPFSSLSAAFNFRTVQKKRRRNKVGKVFISVCSVSWQRMYSSVITLTFIILIKLLYLWPQIWMCTFTCRILTPIKYFKSYLEGRRPKMPGFFSSSPKRQIVTSAVLCPLSPRVHGSPTMFQTRTLFNFYHCFDLIFSFKFLFYEPDRIHSRKRGRIEGTEGLKSECLNLDRFIVHCRYSLQKKTRHARMISSLSDSKI